MHHQKIQRLKCNIFSLHHLIIPVHQIRCKVKGTKIFIFYTVGYYWDTINICRLSKYWWDWYHWARDLLVYRCNQTYICVVKRMTNQMCNYHMFYVSHNGAYPFQQKEMWKYTKICDSSTINHDLLSHIAVL